MVKICPNRENKKKWLFKPKNKTITLELLPRAFYYISYYICCFQGIKLQKDDTNDLILIQFYKNIIVEISL